jgi:hypothetical protein
VVAGSGAPLAQQPTPAPPAGTQTPDPDTAKLILDLKLQALDAYNAGDMKKELDLQQKILRLDPNDARALSRVDEIRKTLKTKETDDKLAVIKRLDDEARQKLAQDWLAKSEEALVAAKQTRDAEHLDVARRALSEARKYARDDDPTLVRLASQIEQEGEAHRLRRWQLWGGAGVLLLVAIVGAVLYFLRSKRVLEMLDGSQMGQVFAIKNKSTTLGALAAEVDWAIEDPLRKISRRHCELIREGRHYWVVDCSMNGTFLNGRPLQKGEPALLKRGDRIGLGGAVTIRFR